MNMWPFFDQKRPDLFSGSEIRLPVEFSLEPITSFHSLAFKPHVIQSTRRGHEAPMIFRAYPSRTTCVLGPDSFLGVLC
jgi:hypothetical protein